MVLRRGKKATYREDHEAFPTEIHDCPVELVLVPEERDDGRDHARRRERDGQQPRQSRDVIELRQ